MDFYQSLDGPHRVREELTIAEFPESIKRTMIRRWIASSQNYYWGLLPVRVAKTHKEVPKWFRKAMHLELKGPRSDNFMPMEIQILLDKWLYSRTQALDHRESIREQLSTKNIVDGAKRVITRYNLRATRTNKEIDESNNETWNKFIANEITGDQAKEMYLKRIPLAEGQPTTTWAKRFKDRFGWRTRRSALPLPIWTAGCANYT